VTQHNTMSNSTNTIIFPGNACASFPHRNAKLIKQRHQFVSHDNIRSVFKQKLGYIPEKIIPVREGKGSCLYMIENGKNERLALKIDLFRDHHDTAQELLFNTIVKSLDIDIPVPDIYVLDLSAEIIPWSYSIFEWLPGTSVLSLASACSSFDMERVFGQIGRSIRLIHDIKLPARGYGNQTYKCIREFIAAGEIPLPLQCMNETFTDNYILPVSKAANYLFDSKVINEKDHAFIKSLLSHEDTDCDESVIQHGDMSMGNFLIFENGLTGILDGSAQIGCRLEELANVYVFMCSLAFHFPYFFAEEAFRAFLCGYGIGYKDVIQDRNYRFFLITKLVGHISILFEMKRLKYIPNYLELMRKYF